jgi:hypothetical protein
MKSLLAPLTLFLLLSIAAITASSCGGTNCADPANAASVKCTVVDATVTCGGSGFDALVAEQGPALEQQIGSAVLGDGSIDYSKIEPALTDAAVKFGACFVAEVFGKLSSVKLAAAPGSSGPPHPTPQALKDTFQKFRAAHYLGKKFVTPAGEL